MWIITNFGFFSVVQKPADQGSGTLTVRARVRSDLEELAKRYLPRMGPIVEHGGTDYPYRATASQAEVAVALLKSALDVDYDNFKSSVAKQQGSARSHLYHGVWSALDGMEAKLGSAPKSTSGNGGGRSASKNGAAAARSKRHSFGGVLVDAEGRVLLRKPTGEFDEYVWTFAKGLQHKGATAEATALREVREETGFAAEIIAKIPGTYEGSTGTNEYFLMKPSGQPTDFDPKETEQIQWATHEEARALIRQTRNRVGRERDLVVLEAAMATMAAKLRRA